MGKLVEHLMPCAICGAVPKINDIYDIDPKKEETEADLRNLQPHFRQMDTGLLTREDSDNFIYLY